MIQMKVARTWFGIKKEERVVSIEEGTFLEAIAEHHRLKGRKLDPRNLKLKDHLPFGEDT